MTPIRSISRAWSVRDGALWWKVSPAQVTVTTFSSAAHRAVCSSRPSRSGQYVSVHRDGGRRVAWMSAISRCRPTPCLYGRGLSDADECLPGAGADDAVRGEVVEPLDRDDAGLGGRVEAAVGMHRLGRPEVVYLPDDGDQGLEAVHVPHVPGPVDAALGEGGECHDGLLRPVGDRRGRLAPAEGQRGQLADGAVVDAAVAAADAGHLVAVSELPQPVRGAGLGGPVGSHPVHRCQPGGLGEVGPGIAPGGVAQLVVHDAGPGLPAAPLAAAALLDVGDDLLALVQPADQLAQRAGLRAGVLPGHHVLVDADEPGPAGPQRPPTLAAVPGPVVMLAAVHRADDDGLGPAQV